MKSHKKCLNIMSYIFLTALLIVTPHLATAEIEGETQREVVDYVNMNIEKAFVPLAENDSTFIDWELKRIRVRVQSQFGIKIPWVTSFQVVPEVEFIIER